MRHDQGNAPPVQEGAEYDVTIEAVGEKGDGIAKKDGFVLFVAGTKTGERKRVKVTKVLPSVGFAEVVGDATTSSDTPRQEKREKRQPEPEEEFDPQEELDSEDF